MVFLDFPFPDLGKFIYIDKARLGGTDAVSIGLAPDDFCSDIFTNCGFQKFEKNQAASMEVYRFDGNDGDVFPGVSFCDSTNSNRQFHQRGLKFVDTAGSFGSWGVCFWAELSEKADFWSTDWFVWKCTLDFERCGKSSWTELLVRDIGDCRRALLFGQRKFD